jgi:hypothetical protein
VVAPGEITKRFCRSFAETTGRGFMNPTSQPATAPPGRVGLLCALSHLGLSVLGSLVKQVAGIWKKCVK